MIWSPRRRRSSFSDRFFAQPTVAEQRARASRASSSLRASGVKLEPVAPMSGAIARTFWGKSWCTNLESYGDYSNRLPRGRTYVRSGAVLHLSIVEGRVTAKVQGSSLYDVTISIKPLTNPRWIALVDASRGDVRSLDALLSGDLPPSVLRIVSDRADGMFPGPREIDFSCSCPDYASMCKHVAATLYGVGARLDTRPELLFLLRGRDHRALVAQAAAATVTDATAAPIDAKLLDGDSLEGMFGIALDREQPAPRSGVRPIPSKRTTPRATGKPIKAPKPEAASKKTAKRDVDPVASLAAATAAAFTKVFGRRSAR